jgi:methyl-accepting chemotaxis protein
MSLNRQGSRSHLAVAITLVAIIPLLCFVFIAFNQQWADRDAPLWPPLIVTAIAFFLAVLGFLMLRRYPRNIVRLRNYLEQIAAGDFPDQIRLEDPEDDLNAIEQTMNMVVRQLRGRVQALEVELDRVRRLQNTIEAQARALVDAERHRIMIESLGAACHHIGQPATVLRIHLNMLKKHAASAPDADGFERCEKAVDDIADILDKLRGVSEYRTVPYQTFRVGGSQPDDRILDIES